MQCVILTLLILQSNPKLYFTKASRTISDDINIPFDQPCGLGKIAKLINAGKIDSSELITMKTLKVLTIFFFFKEKDMFCSFCSFEFLFPALPGYRCYWKTNKGWNSTNGPWSRGN